MTKEAAIKELMELFSNDTELFNYTIEELDNYNGYLGNDRYYCMEELSELYCDADPVDLLLTAYFGYDEGQGPFNPNNNYFRFNGYGNLVSAYEKDYSDHLDEYTVELLIDNANHLYLEEPVSEIIDAIEEED